MVRRDREFTEAEMAEARRHIAALHELSRPPEKLTRAQAEALRLVANGQRLAAASAGLGISESALKARLASARLRLGARTTAEALKLAQRANLI